MTLHLSLLTLPQDHERFRHLTPHALHELVWSASTAGPRPSRHEPAERLLYRHDPPGPRPSAAHSVLVQSERAPDWLGPGGPGLLPAWVQTKALTLTPETVPPGARLRFRLRANPVVRRGRWHPRAGKHVVVGSHREAVADRLGGDPDDLPGRDAQLVRWLAEKAAGERGEPLGFRLATDPDGRPACVPGPPETLRVRKPGAPAPRTLVGVDFEGVLEVADPGALAAAVRAGIGRGKAYGLGLLSLARP